MEGLCFYILILNKANILIVNRANAPSIQTCIPERRRSLMPWPRKKNRMCELAHTERIPVGYNVGKDYQTAYLPVQRGRNDLDQGEHRRR
jgi:hypothetical protein